MTPRKPAGEGAPPPPPPLAGSLGIKGATKSVAPPPSTVAIPSDYAEMISVYREQTTVPDGVGLELELQKFEFETADTVRRVRAGEIDDPNILLLMQNKGIPHFRFDFNCPKFPELGIVEPVPELPDEEFEKFVLGLANVDSLFLFVDPWDFNKGDEGLFEWSIGASKEPSWRVGLRKVTDSHRDVVVACYCNKWKRRAESFGCKFPVAYAIAEGLRWRPNFRAK